VQRAGQKTGAEAAMFVLDDVVVYSASDLAVAARCEYAPLRAFDARLGWGPKVAADGRPAGPGGATRPAGSYHLWRGNM
jgi:hypothetical protein